MALHRSWTRAAGLSLVSLLLATTGVVGVVAPASARCQDPYTTYKVWLVKGVHRPAPHLPRFKDGKGGTVTGSVSRTDSVGATFGVATSVEADAIFAKAKVEVTASVRRDVSVTIGHTYSHHISAGHYGHLAYGSWAKVIGWKKVLHTALCQTEVLKSGRATIPTTSVGWHYWETLK